MEPISNMSETEFVLVAFSIMLALAFAKLMQGLVRGATCEGRYWIHLAWTLHRLIGAFLYFWAFKTLLDRIGGFTFYEFTSVIFSPMLFYAQALLLCPEQPAEVKDWRNYFEEIRKPFFALYLAIMLGNINIVVTLDIDIPVAAFLVQLVTGIVGMYSSNEKVHGALVSINFLSIGLGIALPIMMSI